MLQNHCLQEFEEDFSAVVMERDGLQESLRILQQEYQSVVKESKVISNNNNNNIIIIIISQFWLHNS